MDNLASRSSAQRTPARPPAGAPRSSPAANAGHPPAPHPARLICRYPLSTAMESGVDPSYVLLSTNAPGRRGPARLPRGRSAPIASDPLLEASFASAPRASKSSAERLAATFESSPPKRGPLTELSFVQCLVPRRRAPAGALSAPDHLPSQLGEETEPGLGGVVGEGVREELELEFHRMRQ